MIGLSKVTNTADLLQFYEFEFWIRMLSGRFIKRFAWKVIAMKNCDRVSAPSAHGNKTSHNASSFKLVHNAYLCLGHANWHARNPITFTWSLRLKSILFKRKEKRNMHLKRRKKFNLLEKKSLGTSAGGAVRLAAEGAVRLAETESLNSPGWVSVFDRTPLSAFHAY